MEAGCGPKEKYKMKDAVLYKRKTAQMEDPNGRPLIHLDNLDDREGAALVTGQWDAVGYLQSVGDAM